MKLIVIDKKNQKARLNKLVEWSLYFIGYTLAFLIVSSLFKSFQLSDKHTILWAIIATFIICIINKTIKPIIFTLTIPITGLTMGLFYFIINMGILKLVDILLQDKLNFTNIWILFFISILISLIHVIIEELITKPIIKKVKHHE